MGVKSITVLKEYQLGHKDLNHQEFVDGLIQSLSENNTPVVKVKILKDGLPSNGYLTPNGNLIDITNNNEVIITKEENINDSIYEVMSKPPNFESYKLNALLSNSHIQLSELFNGYNINVPLSFNIGTLTDDIKYFKEHKNVIHVYENLFQKLSVNGLSIDDIKSHIYSSVKKEFAVMIWFQVVLDNNFNSLESYYSGSYKDEDFLKFSSDFLDMIENDFWSLELEELINILGEKHSLLDKEKTLKNSKQASNTK